MMGAFVAKLCRRVGALLVPAGLALLGGAVMAPAAVAMAPSPERPPNIVFIMADDLGYGELASYGQRLYPTPHTDRLAREGVRFTDAHSPNAVCSPTRYGVVTGTDPYRRYHTSHVLFNGEPLTIRPGEATVASLLKKKGYRTGVVGKWHMGVGDALPRDLNRPGRGPNDIGFDYSFIIPDGPDMRPHYYMENGHIEGVTTPEFDSQLSINRRVGYNLLIHHPVGTWKSRRPLDGIAARFAEKTTEFIERHRNEHFFLYFPTSSIHRPLTPDPRFVGKSGVGLREDFVMEFDWAVGQVMETLDRLGLAERTLLIVTSDNGGQPDAGHISGKLPSPNVPWRGYKGNEWEGGHRVPFFARWPGRIAPGTTNAETISLVDLTATACAVAGVSLPPTAALDSYNILPALLGTPGEGSLRPYTVMGTRGIEHLILREGPWKLIYHTERAQSQLYHLGNDPGETADLAASQPGKTAALRGTLMRYVEAGSSRPGAKGNPGSLEALFREREERNRRVQALVAAKKQP